MLLLLLAFVPRPTIKKWFWFGMLWGSGMDIFLILLFKLSHFYFYLNTKPFDFYGVPIWLTFAWIPAIIMFIHFLPQRKEPYIFYLYLSSFAMLGVLIGIFFTQISLIKEIHWHSLLRFPVQFLWLFGTHAHYQALKKSEPAVMDY
jgi:hypothetical protein